MAVTVPEAKTYTYKTDPSGCKIDCDVYVPEKVTKPCPVIMWMHYSNLIFDNRHVVGPQLWWSGTKRGYIVVNIDYRLAPQAKMKDIYEDVEDAAKWIRTVLPKELGEGVVDTSKLIIGGGSCGGLLALTAGLFLSPPPVAIISIYSLVDPTDPEFNIASKPEPPPGRDELIPWSEVEQYLGPNAPMVSHPENGLNMREYKYTNRATANFYLIQEGLLLDAVHGTTTVEEIQSRWGILKNMSAKYPPTWVAHAVEDRYTPVTEAEKLVKALEKNGVEHEYWPIEGNHDHGFDFWEMQPGEEGDFEKEFAGRLWPFLEKTIASCL